MLKAVETKAGRTMYFNEGKLISRDEYLRLMGEGGVATAEKPAVELPSRVCVFCGEAANRTKYLEQSTVWSCDEDYYSHTTGEIVAQARKWRESNAA